MLLLSVVYRCKKLETQNTCSRLKKQVSSRHRTWSLDSDYGTSFLIWLWDSLEPGKVNSDIDVIFHIGKWKSITRNLYIHRVPHTHTHTHTHTLVSPITYLIPLNPYNNHKRLAFLCLFFRDEGRVRYGIQPKSIYHQSPYVFCCRGPLNIMHQDQ